MLPARVQHLLDEIDTLAPSELRLLRDRLAAADQPGAPGEASREAVYQRCVAEGLLLRVPARRPHPGVSRRPARLSGPPLAHTIIEDRR